MIRTIILAIITVIFSYLLNTSLTIGESSIPPLGSFLSPFHGFWQNAEDVNGSEDYIIDNLDLASEVEVIYDNRLVPHIFGEKLEDVLFVQGYIHARNRLWQMDIATRSAAGRVSEVLGKKSLNHDLSQRRKGMPYAAENSRKGWSQFPQDYRLLTKYTAGVNAYINSLEPKDYPVEFKLLDYAPEQWSELHSALFMKNMAMTLCSGYSDIENTNMLNYFGKEKFDYLFPEYNPKQTPIIPRSVKWNFEENTTTSFDEDKIKDIGYLKGDMPSTLEQGIGSNNWAVDGSKTESGNPILCGDPHLQLTLPSIWYEVHLNSEDLNSYGVSLPGIPGVVIGFNDHIAWSETNVGHDVWDFYEMDWVDEKKTKYRINGEIKEVEYRIEEIKVKGGKTVIDTIKITDLGLIAKYKSSDGYKDLAFDWLAHKIPDKPELRSFIDINKATNYNEFSVALENYIAPAQNFAFACTDGDIAIHVNGDLPIKDDQVGRFISDGAKGGNWKGFIPRDQIPKVLNPERGFISSANQYSTGPEYPYYYNGNGYFEQYRGRILNDKLESMSDITPTDMMALHYNSESIKAKEAVPVLLANVDRSSLDDYSKGVISELEKWNFSYEAESKASSYFNEWYRNVFLSTFDEITALKNEMEVRYPSSFVLVRMLEDELDSPFFDIDSTDTKVESGRDIIQSAFDESIKSLKEKDDLQWYKYSKKSINHLAGLEALSRKNIKAKGYGDALNAYGTTAGPSWRMVVSMDDQVTAKVVYPGGQSGNPGSKHYDDMIDSWVDGKYYDAHFVKSIKDLKEYKLFKVTFK